jgi:hypothetical protein
MLLDIAPMPAPTAPILRPRARHHDCIVCGQPADFPVSADATRIICTRCIAHGHSGKFPQIEQDEFLICSSLAISH